ncbi:MAG TPA: PLP-dependent aminotransferase family protein, partial [Sphingomicrobium sp.]|nr:PLP-dependent aminotransferase family protein [Sphingomicrobium sp.]
MSRRHDPLLMLPDKDGVLYVRLYQRMRALILEGSWPPGMRLPSSRTLAADLGIARNTASLALDQLLADGWIETRSRSGTFVSASLPQRAKAAEERQATPRPRALPVPFEMRPGPVDCFPFERWARIQSRVWARSVPDLLYDSEPAGDRGLRGAIADLVLPTRGLTGTADDIVIVTSAQSAFDLVAATVPPGSDVVVEDPGYIFADGAFAGRGLNVVAAPVDRHGLHVPAARARAPSPALILVTPAAQFPLGVSMSTDRRAQLLQWARETGAWIIEEEYDAEARFDGAPPPPPLRTEDPQRVITVSSFNRLLFRSLRLGFMAVPEALREPLLKARATVDGYVGLPHQLVLREFIADGGYSAHIRRSRELARERREALVATLAPFLGSLFERELNPCGLHLVLRPRGADLASLVGALRDKGIDCETLDYLTRGATPAAALLLGFGAFSADVIESMRPT